MNVGTRPRSIEVLVAPAGVPDLVATGATGRNLRAEVLAKLAAGNTACVEEVPNIPVSQLNELMMELPIYHQSFQAPACQ